MSKNEDVIAYSNHIDTKFLIEAYSFGIFPWPSSELEPILWFCPRQRGVLFFTDLHISKSIRKFIKTSHFKLTLNKNFEEVIINCGKAKRPNQSGTWITSNILTSYLELHKMGYAHSVECWEDEVLVGGVYGVGIGQSFSGESMFYKKPNASKICLIYLIELLVENGFSYLDVQMVTPLLKSFGAKEIPRMDFLNLVRS